jgi:hypothetical protein
MQSLRPEDRDLVVNRSLLLRRIGWGITAAALPALLYLPVMHSKLGRWLLDVSVLRVVNQTGSPVKDVRISYTRDSYTGTNYAEIGTLAAGETREVRVLAASLWGKEVMYAFAGEIRTRPVADFIYAGSILEIQFVEGGWTKTLATH